VQEQIREGHAQTWMANKQRRGFMRGQKKEVMRASYLEIEDYFNSPPSLKYVDGVSSKTQIPLRCSVELPITLGVYALDSSVHKPALATFALLNLEVTILHSCRL
jgi:hypothetical protein